jgi:hypothetical protein
MRSFQAPAAPSNLPIFALIALALSACDPAFRYAGTVKSISGLPIAGALVSFGCPEHPAATRTTVVTNASGDFMSLGMGWRPDECTVRVEAQGYQPASYRIGDHCRSRPFHAPKSCLDVHVDARLQAAPKPALR